MTLRRQMANARARERERESIHACSQAVQECRRVARGEKGATYDSFSLILDRNRSPVVASVLRDLSVMEVEYTAWKAAYEADTPQRAVRQQAKEEERIRRDIASCREWLSGERDEDLQAFERLDSIADSFGGGVAEFLRHHEITQGEWSRLRRLASSCGD